MRMPICQHDRIEGVPTNRGSAGTNATRDALEADRQRNMPAALRGRHHEIPRLEPLAKQNPRCGVHLCVDCGKAFGRYVQKQRRCKACQARRRAHRHQVARTASKRSESISKRTVRRVK